MDSFATYLKSLTNMPKKHALLVAFTTQCVAYLLVLRHARTSTPLQEHRPSSATALLTSEGIRLAVSLTFALYEIISDPRTPDTSTATSLFGRLARAVFSSDSWKMVIPALLYTLKNSLQYVAANNLDSQTFEGVSQIRSLLVALFSTVLLGRTLSLSQWTSVLLLMGGVAMVEFSGGADLSPILSMKDLKDGTAFHEARNIWGLKAAGNAAAGHLARRSATYEGIDEDTAVVHPELHHFVGIPTLVIASIASSLAGVYFEKVLKGYRSDHAASVWIRSVQLSFYSIWPALLLSLLFSGESTSLKAGLFDGYNVATWLAIILHAAGGLLVAFVIKHANNVAKEFAIGVSVITGSLVSVSLFDVQLNRLFPTGTGFVILATLLYNTVPEDETKPRPPQIRVAQPEKDDQGSYFDLESIATPVRSPMRTDALSTSRPGTPLYERSSRRAKGSDPRMTKREQ